MTDVSIFLIVDTSDGTLRFLTDSGSGETVAGEEPAEFGGDIRIWPDAASRDRTLEYLHRVGRTNWLPASATMRLVVAA